MPMAVAFLPAIAVAAASVASSIAFSFVSSAITRAFSPSPDTPQSSPDSGAQELRDRLTTIRSSVAVRKLIYGRVRTGGVIVFASSTGENKEYLHIVCALAHGEVTAIDDVYLNDEAVGTLDSNGNVTDGKFADHCRVKKYLGIGTQIADSDLTAECPEWTSNHNLHGIAYVYVRLKFNQDIFVNGIPNISCIVRGRRIVDPRDGIERYTTNPALCIYDYMQHADGMNATGELDIGSFQSAANVCDTTVFTPDGQAYSRYTCNGVVSLDRKPIDIMRDMLTSLNGVMTYSQGLFILFPGYFDTPTVTLTEDDLRGELRVRAKASRRDLFNVVRGTFVDPGQGYQPTEFPSVTVAAYQTQDGEEEITRDIDLPFTQDVYEAQRLAKQVLERSRQGIVVEFPAKLTAMQLRCWDVIQLTSPTMGWVAKAFRISAWQVSPSGGIDMILTEDASSAYTSTVEDQTGVDPAPDTNLPDPFTVEPPILAISDELMLTASGTVISRLIIDLIESPDVFVTDYEIQYRKSTDTNYITVAIGSTTRFTVEGVEDGTLYDVRARARNTLGVRSSFATAQHTVVGQTSAPDDVTDFSANVLGSAVHLTWTANDDLDLSHYRIRWSPVTSGATWASATDLVAKVAKPATSITVPALVGTYLIKAVDLKEIESVNATTSISTIAGLESFNAVESVAEQTAFAGTHSNTAAPDGVLILDTSLLFDSATGNFDDATGSFDAGGGSGYVVSEGTYTFTDYIDLGAVYSSRVTANIELTGIDYEDLFDDAGGNFDDHDGLFDGEAPSFVTATLEIRTTEDDPAGAPTWTAWRQFIVGDYSARAFEFRCKLTSQRASITPAVSVLEVSIDMPDRVQGARNITSDAAGTAITFPIAYKETPVIGVTGNNLATGDYWAITLQSATGFTVRFFTSAGAGVARNFDWLAKGY